MQPKQCQWCEQVFKIEVWVDHTEQCGTKTNKCEECGQWIQRKMWAHHQTSDDCRLQKAEAQRKEHLEQQKRLEELEKFRREEEEQKRRMAEKRELRERKEQEDRERTQREQEAWQRMNQPRNPPASGVRAPSGSKVSGPNPSSAARVSKPVISNNRKPREHEVGLAGFVPKPSTTNRVASNNGGSLSIGGPTSSCVNAVKPSGAGKTAMASQRMQAAGANVVGTRTSGPNTVVTGQARQPNSMMPANNSRIRRNPSPKPVENSEMQDEDIRAIAAALEEEENLALAQ